MKNSCTGVLAAFVLSLCAVPSLSAQQFSPYENGLGSDDPGEVIFESGTVEIVRTSPELRTILRRARPLEPNNVPAPKFAIRTKNNSFILSIGGQINPILGYDIANDLYDVPDAKANFIVGDIPVPVQKGKKGAFFIDPLQAYVDFTVVGFGGTDNEVTGYVKLGTNGVSHGTVFKRAYVSWRGITAGMNATLMKDALAVQPPTIDPQGPCGDVSTTAYALTYTSPSFSGVRFAVGLEMPTFYSSNGFYRGKDFRHEFYGRQVTSEANQLVPDIPAWIEYAASSSNRIRLSGLLRNFAYYDLIDSKTRRLFGWGAMVSGNFSFYKPLTFNFQAAYGRGIANYIQDIAGRPLSFTPKDDNPGEMRANPMMGLVFGASYNATDRLQFNAVGSYARIWDVGEYATVDDTPASRAQGALGSPLAQGTPAVAGSANYRYGVYVAANCFYSITSYLQCGVEYLYGRRDTWGLGGANDHRVQTQLIFSF